MIPKIIHYCWFGGNPLPDEAKRWIETWKQFCPDYQIMEWNEDNFDISQNPYVKEAYEQKKWAFVTDYVRLKVLFDYGGIYMDTDVEVCKSLDDFLHCRAFSGFESKSSIPTGTMGAEAGNEWIGLLLTYYDDRHFVLPDGSLDTTTNVYTITQLTEKYYPLVLNNSYQEFGTGLYMYPFDYLCAKDPATGQVKKTKNTYTIHHFAGSWVPEDIREFSKRANARYQELQVTLPNCLALPLAKVWVAYEQGGCSQILKKCWHGLQRYCQGGRERI